MSSLPRRMQRRVLRARSDYTSAPQPTRMKPNKDGYETLRPTKGWAFFSTLGVRFGQMVAAFHERAALIAMQRRRAPKKPWVAKADARLARRVEAQREADAKWQPSNRQQRRAASRGYRVA